MKVLLATQKPFAASAVNGIKKIVEEAGHEFALIEKYAGENELCEAVKDADAMIVRSDVVSAAVLDAAKQLKIVVRAGAGYDNLDLEACTAHSVVAMNTPGQNANAVAELALGMMIYMSRGQFTPGTGSEISGKSIGIQALGNVGRLVGEKAKALGMEVYAVDPYLSPEDIESRGAKAMKKAEDLYSSCNFISVHIPATAQTKGSIGYSLISRMPKGGILINTARKEVIDEPGLERALEERPDICYATDVAPDCIDRLREKFGNRVFATGKKMGAQTVEANVNAGLAAAKQICAYFQDGCTKFQLNK